MPNRILLASSAMLLLSGCGSYDLGGMPRVVANAGFNPGVRADAAQRADREQQFEAETARQLEVLQREQDAQDSRLERRENSLVAQGLALSARRDALSARSPAPAELANVTAELATVLEDLDEVRDQRRTLARRISERLDQQQSQLLRRAGFGLTGASANAPPDRLENFGERFARHALAAQNNGEQPGDIDLMLDSGFLLVRSNCEDFFARMRIVQRDADIGRDLVAPVISILTGIVQLRNLDQEDSDELLSIFGLASTTAIAGISVVDKHFLFSADNIQDVQDLVIDAFDAQEEHVETLPTISFSGAARQLIDYQLICTPAQILRLTRQAIAAGDVVADENAGPSADERVRANLAEAIGLQGTLTDRQALALWKLYMDSPDLKNLNANVVTLITGANLDRLVDTTGSPAKTSADGDSYAGRARELLRTLPRATQTRYRDAPLVIAAAPPAVPVPRAFGAPVAAPSNPQAERRSFGRRARLRVQ